MVRSIFAGAIALDPVRIRRRRWLPFQSAIITMAPMGHIHFAPSSPAYRDDFAAAPITLQALFIHEMTHVWQSQCHGRWYLPLHRHPFCRYSYSLRPGWPLVRYGIEQQAEIVCHAYLARHGHTVPGAPGWEVYRTVLPADFAV